MEGCRGGGDEGDDTEMRELDGGISSKKSCSALHRVSWRAVGGFKC